MQSTDLGGVVDKGAKYGRVLHFFFRRGDEGHQDFLKSLLGTCLDGPRQGKERCPTWDCIMEGYISHSDNQMRCFCQADF